MSNDPMSSEAPVPASNPRLNPQFCLNTTALRDFLRLSRSTIDDSVSLHLNALLTPSRTPFTTTATRCSTSDRHQIPGATCRTFKNEILFPSWKSRDDIFTYCSSLAAQPESLPSPTASPTQPTPAPFGSSISGAPAGQADSASPSSASPPQGKSRWSIWGQERTETPDERTDPYSARDYSYNRYSQAEVLKDVIANEQGVERIVRSRTWSLLGERCLDDEGGVGTGTASSAGWEEALRVWRDGRGR